MCVCISKNRLGTWGGRNMQHFCHTGVPKVNVLFHLQLWCWRRLLRAPWTARRSNQSVLKEINLEYSLEGLMLKLKLQYFGHLMWRAWFTGKDPDAGKDWGQEEKEVTSIVSCWMAWDGWMSSLTQWTWVWANSGRQWKTGRPGMLQSLCWGHKESDVTEWLNNNTSFDFEVQGEVLFLHWLLSSDTFHRILELYQKGTS